VIVLVFMLKFLLFTSVGLSSVCVLISAEKYSKHRVIDKIRYQKNLIIVTKSFVIECVSVIECLYLLSAYAQCTLHVF